MKYKPPLKAIENARKAKECLAKGSKAMTRVGRYRTTQLAQGKSVSLDVVKRMAKFARHRKNKSYKGNPCKDRGYVAWMGWGGDAGIKWAQEILDE
jgi:hypothetical protein